MSFQGWYRPDGTPMLDVNELHQWDAQKVVRQERVWWGGRVSTVWLGLDHSYSGGPPLIYETMVFPPKSYLDLFCDRYALRAEAEQGHAAAVRWARWRGLWAWGVERWRSARYSLIRVLEHVVARMYAARQQRGNNAAHRPSLRKKSSSN
jgi:hypothetical protein